MSQSTIFQLCWDDFLSSYVKPEACATMRVPGLLSNAFSLNASARQSASKLSRFQSIGVSPKIQEGYQNKIKWVFVRDYARAIFSDSILGMTMYVSFLWIYEMEQFKLKVGRCFALTSNQWWDLICLLLGAAIFY